MSKKMMKEMMLEQSRLIIEDQLWAAQQMYDLTPKYQELSPALILAFYKMFCTKKKGMREAVLMCFLVKSRLAVADIEELIIREEGRDTTEPWATIRDLVEARMLVENVHAKNTYSLSGPGSIELKKIYGEILYAFQNGVKKSIE